MPSTRSQYMVRIFHSPSSIHSIAKSFSLSKPQHILSQLHTSLAIISLPNCTNRMPIAEESDVVVEIVSDLQNPDTTSVVAKALIELLKRKPHIVVIYTSGTWVSPPLPLSFSFS